MAVKAKRKKQAEIINLPEEYILRNRYTQFLHNMGKCHIGRISTDKCMLICWYIGPETGRLIGAFWEKEYEHARFLAFNIAKNGMLSFDDEGEICTWDLLFDRMRQSPKNYYAPSMAYVFNGYVDPSTRTCGKIIPFPTNNKKPA